MPCGQFGPSPPAAHHDDGIKFENLVVYRMGSMAELLKALGEAASADVPDKVVHVPFVANAIATTASSSANKRSRCALAKSLCAWTLANVVCGEGIDAQAPGQISQLLENAEAARDTKQHERAIDYCSQVGACVRLARSCALPWRLHAAGSLTL